MDKDRKNPVAGEPSEKNDGRFKSGKLDPKQAHQIKGANRPWSIHHSLVYLSAQESDDSTPTEGTLSFREQLILKLTAEGKKPTFAQLGAIAIIEKMAKGDLAAVGMAMERIDGKIANTNINADLDNLNNLSDHELEERAKKLRDRIRGLQDAVDGNGDSGGSGGADGGKAEGQEPSASVDAISGAANTSSGE